jgi:radical SAM superfamily enzyme YgiQ (UPF0313 family)
MKPRVLLVAPAALDFHGRPIRKKRLYLPGLTLVSLAAVTPDDYDLTLVNEPVHDLPLHEHWDLVALTGMGSGLKRAWQLGDLFRARGSKVVIGGIAASLAPADWSMAHADALVTGEAEQTWPALLADFSAGRLQPRYTMRERPDVATLPVPRYDLLSAGERGMWRPVQATRGCPFPCEFCSVQSFFNRTYRKRPIEHILRDVRAAKATGSRYITFLDDNIGVDWKFFQQLMEALVPENIVWASQCSLHIADRPDMLTLAYRSGCRILSFGLESLSRANVTSVSKTFNHPERYPELLRCVTEHGIAVSTEMIVGLDADTQATLDATCRFLLDNRVPLPRLYILTPVPGTPMHRQFLEAGRIFNHDIADYNGGKAVFHPTLMSAEALQRGYWDIYERLYSYRAITHRMRGLPRRLELPVRTVMLGTNLHYRRHVRERITPGIV